ncbi:MAG TPA: hypothetical protein ENJ78_01175, partial [candidate division WWE3 bacterium]|nr:hypothetical protein [candidate division WWE3 bacterium]
SNKKNIFLSAVFIFLFSLFSVVLAGGGYYFWGGIYNYPEKKAETASLSRNNKLYLSSSSLNYHFSGLFSYSIYEPINISAWVPSDLFPKGIDKFDLDIYTTSVDSILKTFSYSKQKVFEKEYNYFKTEYKTDIAKRPNLNSSDYALIKSLSVENTKKRFGNVLSTALTEELSGKKGPYYVEVFIPEKDSSSKRIVSFYLLVSDFGVFTTTSDKNTIFWAQDFKSDKSVNPSRLVIYSLDGGVKRLESPSFSNGLAEIPINSQADLAVAYYKNYPTLIPLRLSAIATDYVDLISLGPYSSRNTSFVFTDRPIYKPGDVLHYKGFIKEDTGFTYILPKYKNVTIRIYAQGYPEGDPIYSKVVSIDDFGGFAGDFTLPKDIDLGRSSLFVYPGINVDGLYSYVASVPFEVEHYRKPQYSISVSSEKNTYVLGDNITFNIKGDYFSGHPLSQAKVSYKLYRSPWPSYDKSFVSPIFYYHNNIIKEGELTLDKFGLGTLTFSPSDYNVASGSTSMDGAVYTLEASYVDQTGNPVLSASNVYVHNGIFRFEAQNYRFSATLNEPYTLSVLLKSNVKGITDFSNKKVTYTINRSWTEEKKISEGKYKYIYRDEYIKDKAEVFSDANNTVNISFTPKLEGFYTITLTSNDSKGNIITDIYYVGVYKDYLYKKNKDDYSQEISITPEKKEYSPGEEMVFNILSSKSRDVLLTLDREFNFFRKVLSLKKGLNKVKLPVLDYYIPNIYANVYTFYKNHLLQAFSGNIKISSKTKKLNIIVTPDKERYGPGDTVHLKLQVKDVLGTNKKASLIVWVVDKSVFELASTNLGDIFDTFWKLKSSYIFASHSLRGIEAYAGPPGIGGGCFSKDTKVLMGSGKEKPIKDVKVGD